MRAPRSLFSIFRRGRPLADFGWLGLDLHNHILPGIDDGAPDVLTSTQMLAGLKRLGFDGAYATPHIMAEVYPNTPATIERAAHRLGRALGESYRGLLRGVAAEYMLDREFDELLAGAETRALALPGRRLLVEWSLVGEPLGLGDRLAAITRAGYRPVVAHPERYRYWHGRPGRYRELVERGCELQVNLLSLVGRYGSGARRAGLGLLDEGLASFAASDAHTLADVEALDSVLRDRTAAAALRAGSLQNAELAGGTPIFTA